MPLLSSFASHFSGNSDSLCSGLSASLGLLAQAAAEQPELNWFQQLLSSPFLLLGSLMAMFYFIVLAPERRRRSQETERLAAIKKNDRIVTVGGIHGVVSAIHEGDILTIRLDESGNNKMRIDRRAVARVVNE